MEKNLDVELKKYKEEFDFLHKKIGELEWELATIFHRKKAIKNSEIALIEEQLTAYRTNISILVEKVRNYITDFNKINR